MNENIKTLYVSGKRKFFIISVYIFLILTLSTPVLSLFFSAIDKNKELILLSIFSFSMFFLLEYLKIIEAKLENLNSFKNDSVIYESTMANYSDIENEILRKKNCKIFVLANSLKTIWNTILKQTLLQVDIGNLDSLELTIIKQGEGRNVGTDQLIEDVKIFYQGLKKNRNISFKIYTYDQSMFFTGILINDRFMKYRMRNAQTKKDVMTTCYMGNSKIDDTLVQWFEGVVGELAKKEKLVLDSDNI